MCLKWFIDSVFLWNPNNKNRFFKNVLYWKRFVLYGYMLMSLNLAFFCRDSKSWLIFKQQTRDFGCSKIINNIVHLGSNPNLSSKSIISPPINLWQVSEWVILEGINKKCITCINKNVLYTYLIYVEIHIFQCLFFHFEQFYFYKNIFGSR